MSLLCSSEKQKPLRKVVKTFANHYAQNISNGVCSACNGYYGPAHGQSVCATCHAFLYATDLDQEVNEQLASVEHESDSDSDHDSGNDEPQEFLFKNANLVGAVGVERNKPVAAHNAEPQPLFYEKKPPIGKIQLYFNSLFTFKLTPFILMSKIVKLCLHSN